ncbi:electron transport complex subunit RsxC [Shewanella inventionis]|uniref:electron transport complex subunit RsxC n=1 Tax=Shewanella inventionis TaxID=1738770 RepID=UPI001CBE17AE|nr:electron transport complex subunit RsxC [Shewanella inventionis]UAL41899.1 electron transport complex subunit RsxC [Shewanella inventionis]
MLTLLEQLDKGFLWQSPGGIHPPQLKTLSNQSAISRLPLAKRFIVPVPLVGEQAILTVSVGDKVLKGQALTEGSGFTYLPVHAPTSGHIIAIEQHASNHASALPILSCVIEADGLDTWCELTSSSLEQLSKTEILSKIKQAGIAGMGGAAFPSHVKLNPASEIDLVIINGIECEPYITSDDRLMRDHSDEILAGVGIIHHLLNPQRIIIAIEDNKPEAAKNMQAAIERSSLPKGQIRVTVIPTKYPSGGEKQLIQIITGKEVPSGAIPAQLGIVVHNVGTAYAIQDAIYHGKPLVERVVTLTGENIAKPGNYWLPLGTTVADALQAVDFKPSTQQKVIVGGPMMGYALADLDVPILKGTNCLLVPSPEEIAPDTTEKACIRCGECAVACPALLLPQQLFWHAKAQEYDKAASFNLKDCIECGCCSYVCPSDIPLVEYYRVAKSALKTAAEEKRQAEQAKIRFEARLQRLEDEKNAREAKAKEAAAKRQANMKSSDKDAVAAAMARIAAKKAQAESNTSVSEAPTVTTQTAIDPKKASVNAAIERAKAKKAAQADTSNVKATEHTDALLDNINADDVKTDDKQAKVAAAIARAKAKKAAQANDVISSQTDAITGSEHNKDQVTPPDDKQARVAAAVARAKAKKLAQAAANSSVADPIATPDANVPTESTDPTDANDSSADHSTEPLTSSENAIEPQTADSSVSDKQARVAAAVAKAKAKKLAQAAANSSVADPIATTDATVPTDANDSSADHSTEPLTSSENAIEPQTADSSVSDKQARVAAAVAKAKAKKLAQVAEDNQDQSLENQHNEQHNEQHTEMSTALSPEQAKKAKVAAAVAKAKAKKLAKSAEQEEQ